MMNFRRDIHRFTIMKLRSLGSSSQGRVIDALKIALLYLILKVAFTVGLRAVGVSTLFSEIIATAILGVTFVGYLSYIVFTLVDVIDSTPLLQGPKGEKGDKGDKGDATTTP